jgi:amino acid adenylation domain-containing protein
MALYHWLDRSARERDSQPAVIEGSGAGWMDYRTLGALSDRVQGRLAAMGVKRGDRVGLYLRKSIDGIASIFGILKQGAAYVPVDPTAPASRNAYIHNNCNVKVAILEKRFEASYKEEIARLGGAGNVIVLDDTGGGRHLEAALDRLDARSPAATIRPEEPAPEDLAYILYTSGSTGTPKGVMLSHRNAISFVDWCSETFQPLPTDVFSSHAPFHFDLSILDIYVPIKHGAALVLIPEETGKEPQGLARLIDEHRITVWYSAPSTLSLMAQFGRISECDVSSLRMVLFAGEVFPVVHLRSFKKQVPHPRYFNLYGPTETNVCTWYEIPGVIPENRADPYPIGITCSNLESKVVGVDGSPVPPGAEGELCIAGPNVMQGYWGMPEQTAASFLPDDGGGKRWYKTGDIVATDPEGSYRYLGRRDRMVKRRGYRIELGEIEACLYRHPDIRHAAVVSRTDESGDVRVRAHLCTGSGKRPSTIELKVFCSKHLPVYMVPDSFAFHAALPMTSTGKVDYVSLKNLA